MTENGDSEIRNHPDFRRLQAMRARLSGRFSLLILGFFTLFVLASALIPDAMATRLFAGAPFSWAHLAAFLMIVVPVFLAALFLRKTDRTIEPLRARLAEKRASENPQTGESPQE